MIVNALVRQARVSAQEVMGENGLNAVLRNSGLERFIGNFPPNDTNPGIQTIEYACFNEAIESFYGRGGKGMLRRIGKASLTSARLGRPCVGPRIRNTESPKRTASPKATRTAASK